MLARVLATQTIPFLHQMVLLESFQLTKFGTLAQIGDSQEHFQFLPE